MRLSSPKNIFFLVGMLCAVIPAGVALAADATREEYSVKVALIYNFIRFTEWPAESFVQDQNVLQIMIYADESLLSVFDSIDGTIVGEHKIAVTLAEKPKDVRGCHLLFLPKTERDQWSQIKAALGQKSVLTVGEMNGFLESGGVINLHMADNKIRFQVDLDHAQSRNLMISSRILKFASSVVREEGGRNDEF